MSDTTDRVARSRWLREQKIKGHVSGAMSGSRYVSLVAQLSVRQTIANFKMSCITFPDDVAD